MRISMLFMITAVFFFCSCNIDNTTKPSGGDDTSLVVIKDSVVFSFAFTGCNRVGWESGATPSTANHIPLDSIFSDMQNLKRKPELFFNLGDIVRAEQPDVTVLDGQLDAWTQLLAVKNFDASGIKMIAVPGNHELLQSYEQGPEYPLKGSTEVWSKYMSKYVPANASFATKKKNELNDLSFSFTQGTVGFIVLNTDTYNDPQDGQKFGFEGVAPIKWAISEIESLKANAAIKHIFVLGHRPYYIYGTPEFGHKGLPNGGTLWNALQENDVVAMLSAHTHDYYRYQHNNKGPTQVIAGNAGSPGSSKFFGYSLINVYKSGKTQLISRGYCVPSDYKSAPTGNMQLRDSTYLSIDGNSNPLEYPYLGCK